MTTYTQRVTTCLLPQTETVQDNRIRYTVVWRSGINTQGTLLITLPDHLADGATVAELAALHHLLEVASVAGTTATGHRLLIVVSQGAIKKLALDRSTKNHLYPWAQFLKTRFAGAEYAVDRDCQWILPRAEQQVHEVFVDQPFWNSVANPRIGSIQITKHAWERFAKHMNYPDQHKLWHSLSHIVGSRSLFPMPASGPKFDRDKNVHGNGAVRFFDPRTKWVLVVARDGDKNILLTAYLAVGHKWLRHHRSAISPSTRHVAPAAEW